MNDLNMPANTETLKLIPPVPAMEKEYLRYLRAFLDAGERPPYLYELALQDFHQYMQKMADTEMGIGIEPGSVAMSTYWLVNDEEFILGSSSFRHALTPDLEDLGGNIGYKIHPLRRRMGYGTLILKLTLEKAREYGLRQVLITCDADNIGSACVIKNNGGVLASRSFSQKYEREVSRYWIQL